MSAAQLTRARYQAVQARRRFASTAMALQQRLKPGALAEDAWDGVRDKGSALADDAIQAVKDRPVATAGVLAGIAMFLARAPLKSAATRLLARPEDRDERSSAKRKKAAKRTDTTSNEGASE